MSTKNLFYSSSQEPGQAPRLLLFLFLSILVHLFGYLIMLNTGALQTLIGKNGGVIKKAPLEVEMVALPTPKKPERKSGWTPVIDLPSTVKSTAPKKSEVVRYADRDVSVKKESVPKPGADMESSAASKRAAQNKRAATSPNKRESGERAERKNKEAAKEATTHKSVKGKGIKEEHRDARVVPQYMQSRAGAEVSKAQKQSLFPSRERMAALAKSSPATARRGKPGKILQLNTTKLIYQKYLLNVRDRVSFYWEYPITAARNGWQGTLTVDFAITRDGSVIDVKIDHSSSYPVLDDAAITAIKLAGPFFDFPEYFKLDRLNVRYQFEYRLTKIPGQGQ